MARVRKISKTPPKSKRNYFVVDASFLAEKYLPLNSTPATEKLRVRETHKWWKEIDRQIADERARVYVPDLCIAEAFKVLAKKYYVHGHFKTSHAHKMARDKLANDVSTSSKQLKAQKRYIGYHDVPASRDIIIAVDRFYELFLKNNHHVGVIDLIIVATAKWLMDFYDAERSQIHLITYDKALRAGSRMIGELPNAYDPSEPHDEFSRVFK